LNLKLLVLVAAPLVLIGTEIWVESAGARFRRLLVSRGLHHDVFLADPSVPGRVGGDLWLMLRIVRRSMHVVSSRQEDPEVESARQGYRRRGYALLLIFFALWALLFVVPRSL